MAGPTEAAFAQAGTAMQLAIEGALNLSHTLLNDSIHLSSRLHHSNTPRAFYFSKNMPWARPMAALGRKRSVAARKRAVEALSDALATL